MVEQTQQNEQKERNYNECEFNYNCFVRSFSLSESADDNGITAKYDSGVLHIEIPKKEEAKTQSSQIEISYAALRNLNLRSYPKVRLFPLKQISP